jgi:Family of unknown function (DUF5677)
METVIGTNPEFTENNFAGQSLELVSEIQQELAEGLDSLAGKTHRGLEDQFPFYSASHINRAVEGYVLLRQQFRLDASRLLIRPAIEAAIKILAVQKQPELLYQIAYSERLDDQKLIRKGARSQGGADELAQEQRRWDDFVKMYRDHFPTHKLEDKNLPLRVAAIAAGIEDYYDSAYRVYCQFTHAAFRAITGNLDELYVHDNPAMGLCALTGLEAVGLLGGTTPDVELFRSRMVKLGIKPSG